EVVVVADLERAIVLVLVRDRIVAGDVCDLRSVRTPGELLHTALRVGDAARVAAVHRRDPDLPLAFGSVREERDLGAVGRPSRPGHAAALERERALIAAGD